MHVRVPPRVTECRAGNARLTDTVSKPDSKYQHAATARIHSVVDSMLVHKSDSKSGRYRYPGTTYVKITLLEVTIILESMP